MGVLLIIVFVLGYIAIAMEHTIKVNKAATALLTGGICWTLLVLGKDALIVTEGEMSPMGVINYDLGEHLSEIAEILFFLLGAMTIVELIDAHNGFSILTDKIKSTSKVKLLWILGFITFFSSATLDNLTTTIVMAAVLSKLMSDKEDLWIFGGMVILAANAGGAWSPIGDVTTIMLWIGNQVTASNIMAKLLLPSLMSLIVPLIILSFKMKGNVVRPSLNITHNIGSERATKFQKKLILILGVMALLFVPLFKMTTHLPPYLGMLLSLGFMWVVSEYLHKVKTKRPRNSLVIENVIKHVDVPTVMFFLGILLAVGALQTAGYLKVLSQFLENNMGGVYGVNTAIGLLSSIVDNVPLVAGTMGMYPLSHFPTDHIFWELLAFCAGTGGSVLIIGSAAGVAMMGLLHINFFWYVKHISILALAGYFSGIGTFYLLSLL